MQVLTPTGPQETNIGTFLTEDYCVDAIYQYAKEFTIVPYSYDKNNNPTSTFIVIRDDDKAFTVKCKKIVIGESIE